MKRLVPLVVNDVTLYNGLCTNNRLTHRALLQAHAAVIHGQYNIFVTTNGDPIQCNSVLNTQVADALRYYFKSPPSSLTHIATIRQSSPDVCSMCGSLKTTSVDHYLPQSSHPDWALFSLNLIPACDCNTLRQNAISTTNPAARILHPYFDIIMNTRLLSWAFAMNPNRSISIVSWVTGNNNVDFHLSNVVFKTNLLDWLEKSWAKLLNKPSNVILTLSSSNRITQADLIFALNDLLRRYDQSFGTPNNWNSIFIHGLLNLGAADYALIVNTHNNSVP